MQGQDVSAGLYRKPEILNRQRHGSLRYDPRRDGFRFAAQVNSVPLATAEYDAAAAFFPLLFARNAEGGVFTLALLGLRSGENLFVTDDGQWDAGYLPAFIRRYPFAMARDGARLGVCIDAASPELGLHSGEPLFTGGGANTPLTDGVVRFLAELQQALDDSRRFHEQLAGLGLLEDVAVQVTGGTEPQTLGGLMAVDENRVRALPPGTQDALASSGAMRLIQIHLLSLATLDGLTLRLARRRDAAAQATGRATSQATQQGTPRAMPPAPPPHHQTTLQGTAS
ncbi:MAG: SapC family protein [Pseudomonadota bacterium]